MTRTLDEFRAAHPRRPQQDRMPNLQAIMQERVRITALTNDERWDHFLRYIEAGIKLAESHLQEFVAKLRDPMMVNSEEILRLKAKINSVEARIETLNEVLMLPKLLVDSADKAEAIIEQMRRDAA